MMSEKVWKHPLEIILSENLSTFVIIITITNHVSKIAKCNIRGMLLRMRCGRFDSFIRVFFLLYQPKIDLVVFRFHSHWNANIKHLRKTLCIQKQ